MEKLKIIACQSCRKLFQSLDNRELCPECSKEMEVQFDIARKYIRDNKDIGVNDVSEACNMPKKQILKWIREERLFFSKDSGVGVPCLKCGMIIQSGKYCNGCKTSMTKDLKGVYVEHIDSDDVAAKKNKSDRLRFSDKG